MNTKKCTKCKLIKYEVEFNKKGKNGLQCYCKQCATEIAKGYYSRRYANKNKDVIYALNKELKTQCKQLVADIKEKYGCVSCKNEFDSNALDCHHVDPNEKDNLVSYLAQCKSKKKLIMELEKCIVLCANCHRKVHSGTLSLTKYIIKIVVDDDTKDRFSKKIRRDCSIIG